MAVSADLGKASIAIEAVMDQLDKDLAGARKQVDGAVSRMARGAGRSFQMVGKAALGGIGVAAGAVTGLSAALGKVTVDAAPVQGISDAFEGLAESAGTSQEEMLAALKEGSAGMISQRDLMMQFNEAAQLVSTDFAKQLPDAMQYLGKISASTGQDMGFLMDSLVKGVGRMSPMILDNLNAQVSLAEATDRATEMYGVQASELTKAQQQAGMMSVVMEKLAQNTADMPDVSESAAAKMAQMRATIQDTKDQIGMALLPVLSTLMDTFAELAAQILPSVTAAVERIAPVIAEVAGHVGDFVSELLGGEAPLVAFRGLLTDLFPAETVGTIMGVVTNIRDFLSAAREAVAPIVNWITRNVKLQDVLIALAAAIGSVVLPVLWTIAQPILAAIAVFTAVMAIVAALRTAWETDFLGMRTALTNFWVNTAQPALRALGAWLSEKIPLAIKTTVDFWENTLQPALKAVSDFITEKVIPAIEDVVAWLKENIPAAVETAKGVLDGIKSTFDDIAGAIEGAVSWVGDFIEKIKQIKLPGFLQRHSPPPLAQSFVDIHDAVERLTRTIPIFRSQLARMNMHHVVAMEQSSYSVEASALGRANDGGRSWRGDINIYGARDPHQAADAVIQALQDRGIMPSTLLR